MKHKVTLDAIVGHLKEKVYRFEENYSCEIDREGERVRITATGYPIGYAGHVEWIAEVALYLELNLTARVVDNDVVLEIW